MVGWLLFRGVRKCQAALTPQPDTEAAFTYRCAPPEMWISPQTPKLERLLDEVNAGAHVMPPDRDEGRYGMCSFLDDEWS